MEDEETTKKYLYVPPRCVASMLDVAMDDQAMEEIIQCACAVNFRMNGNITCSLTPNSVGMADFGYLVELTIDASDIDLTESIVKFIEEVSLVDLAVEFYLINVNVLGFKRKRLKAIDQ